MRRILSLLILLSVVGGVGAFWYWRSNSGRAPTFRTAKVERGPLIATISATGTIQPEEVIDVGAQVNGRIVKFGIEPRSAAQQQVLLLSSSISGSSASISQGLATVLPTKSIDYSTPVEVGTVLARLDQSLFLADVTRARADLERALATMKLAQAKYSQAERDWSRAQDLSSRRAIAAVDYDLAQSVYEIALAGLDDSRAAIAQAKADLSRAETNLGYTIIRSPVKGVIISRRVNVGQTVISNMNAQSLFLIAKDLRKLQVWASVNEADIGQIRPGQQVEFTVDTYPNQVFTGQVAPDQPRLDANMTSNVVTYTVVINTDNSHLKFKPYLTANAKFLVQERSQVLRVPNSALRWRPALKLVAPEYRDEYARSLKQGRNGGAAGDLVNRATLWVTQGEFVQPVHVRTGLTDGAYTEVLDGDIDEGTEVVIREDRQDSGGGGGSPFTPSMFGGGKKQPQ